MRFDSIFFTFKTFFKFQIERKKLSDYLFNGNNSSSSKTSTSPDKTIRSILEEPKDKTSLTNKICPKPIRKAVSNLLACFVNVQIVKSDLIYVHIPVMG